MISKALYNIAAVYFLVKGISTIVQLQILMGAQEATRDEYSAIIYTSPLLLFMAGIFCWYLAVGTPRTIDDNNSPQVTESKLFAMGLFFLGLFFLANYLPELVQKYIQYQALNEIGTTEIHFGSPASAFWVLVAKSFIGAALLLLSFSAKKLFYFVRSLGT